MQKYQFMKKMNTFGVTVYKRSPAIFKKLILFWIIPFTGLHACNGSLNVINGNTNTLKNSVEINAPSIGDTRGELKTNANGIIIYGDNNKIENNVDINAPINNTYIQSEYKSLDVKIFNEIQSKIENLTVLFPSYPSVIIEIESGNTIRTKIAKTLEKLFSIKNMGRFSINNTFLGRYPGQTMSILIHPSNKEFASSLLEITRLYISADINIIMDDKFSKKFIKIYINGEPIFDMNGKVRLQ